MRRAAESESGAGAAGAAPTLRLGPEGGRRGQDAGMLRTPEPRPGNAGAVGCSPHAVPPTQTKPLTSFFIQDILWDGADRRGGHAGSPQPQPSRQPSRLYPRRDPKPEPERGRGGARAPEDQQSDQPRAGSEEAEKPAETEPGKPARLERPGWAGLGPPGRMGRPTGCNRVRAGARRTSRTSGGRVAGPRGDRRRGLHGLRLGRASELNPEPRHQGCAGFRHGLDSPRKVPCAAGSWCPELKGEQAHSSHHAPVPDGNPDTSKPPLDP